MDTEVTDSALAGFTSWPEDFACEYRRKGYWHGRTFGQLLDDWSASYGDKEAIVCGAERISYRTLAEESDRLANCLLGLGLRRNDRLIVQMPNVPAFALLLFALFRIGALPVLALPAHREREITHIARLAAAKAYVVTGVSGGFDYLQMASSVRDRVDSLKHVLVAGEIGDFTVGGRPLEDAPDETGGVLTQNGPSASDVALFLLSGGTTGLPKLIPRTHDDYAYNVRESARVCGFGADTRYLVTLPVAHNFPLACPGLLGALYAGGTAVMSTGADPETVFPLIAAEHITATAVVPALAIRWMDSDLLRAHDLSSLELLQVGGSKLNPETARRIRPILDCGVQQVFGMAEGLINYTRPEDPDEVIYETQGRPMSPDDEVRVVDPEGNEVPQGEVGELLTRGPYTLRGYYRAEKHNARAFTPDGFYRSGDMVRWHSSGNLVVEGRDKDLINRGGEKISAEEVENLILGHPKVLNTAVVAIPDPVLGERACAYVVTREDTNLTLEELVDFLMERKVAKFKLPERLEVVEDLPLTKVGKLDKKALREDIADKLRRPSGGGTA